MVRNLGPYKNVLKTQIEQSGIATVTFTCNSPKDFNNFHRCVLDKQNGYRSCLCDIQHPS